MFVKILIPIFFIGSVFISSAFAYEEYQINDAISFLELSLSSTPKRPIKDSALEYGAGLGKISGNIPFYKHFDPAAQSIPFIQLSARPEASRIDTVNPLINQNINFYSLNLGLQTSLVSSGQEFYMVKPSVGYSEEADSFDRAKLKWNIMGLGTYHTKQEIRWLYGAAYSYVFGNRKLFPLLGFFWKFKPDWELVTILPLVWSLHHHVDQHFLWAINISPFGDRFHMDNHARFAGHDDDIYFREVGIHLGGLVAYSLEQWILGAQFSLLGGHKLAYADSSGDFLSGDVKGGASLGVFARWHFGSPIRERLGI